MTHASARAAWWQQGGLTVVLGLVLLVLACWLVYGGAKEQLDGEIALVPLAAEHVAAHVAAQKRAAPEETNRILFGDLHVHTTLWVDAFMWGLPLMGGAGVHSPADACDFARFCSQLDFYALTDHAEALNPRTWKMIRDSVRQCKSVTAGSELRRTHLPEPTEDHEPYCWRARAQWEQRPCWSDGATRHNISTAKFGAPHEPDPLRAYPYRCCHCPGLDSSRARGQLPNLSGPPTSGRPPAAPEGGFG